MDAGVAVTISVARFERAWARSLQASSLGPLPQIREFMPDGPDEVRFLAFIALAFSERVLCLRSGLDPHSRDAQDDKEFGGRFASSTARIQCYNALCGRVGLRVPD